MTEDARHAMDAPGPQPHERPADMTVRDPGAAEPGIADEVVSLAGEDAQVIGERYRLDTPIGHGSMGTVWRSWDELLHRVVAVKEIRFPAGVSRAERERLCQRMLSEARSAARLSHPAVAKVHNVVVERGRPWIVMEFVHGRPLDRIIKTSGALPPDRVAELGCQILAALAAAHRAGVLHRDVKPGNVLLTGDGKAVLTDFGIATIDGDPRLTQSGTVMGTPAFLAPERIRGDAATPAADLYSLGATLYAAVEGQGPYDNFKGAAATMAAVVTVDPPPLTAAGTLTAAITALLSRDPANRPSSDDAMGMLKAAAAAGARARGYRSPGHRRRRARWALPPAMAVALACLIAALLVLIWLLAHHTGRVPTKSKSGTVRPAAVVVPASGGGSGTPTPRPSPTGSCTAAAWVSSTVYVSGNVVSYDGRKWVASQWSYDEVPEGPADAWKNDDPC